MLNKDVDEETFLFHDENALVVGHAYCIGRESKVFWGMGRYAFVQMSIWSLVLV